MVPFNPVSPVERGCKTRMRFVTHELAENVQLRHKGNVAPNTNGASQHQRCGV